MIAIDTNVWAHAHRRDSPHHEAARRAVATPAEGRDARALPWPCVHEFYAIVTHPRVYAPPSTAGEAVGQIEIWLESPTLLLPENPQHWSRLRDVITQARRQGPTVHGARIAALCLSHGVRELWTADRDFSRFPGLRTRNPLLGA